MAHDKIDDNMEAIASALYDNIDDHIREVGWSVISVGADADANEPPFTYTIGLALKGLPELIVFGLPPLSGYSLVQNMATIMVRDGRPSDGDLNHDIANMPAALRYVPTELAVGNYMFQVPRYYRSRELSPAVDVVQLFWPDPNGKFSWEADFEEKFRPYQNRIIDPRVTVN